MLEKLSFDEAMQMIAERAVYERHRRLQEKSADAATSQAARRELGILAADPAVIDSAVAGIRSGDIAPRDAFRQMQRAVPGITEQIGNIPAAVGIASRQGDDNSVLKQLDVLGLKNVLPGTAHFNPLTVAESGAAAATTAGGVLAGKGLINKFKKNLRMYDVLHGDRPDVGELLKKTPQGTSIAKDWGARVEKWRAKNPRDSSAIGGFLKKLKQGLIGYRTGDVRIGKKPLSYDTLAAATGKIKPAAPANLPAGGLQKLIGSLPIMASAVPMLSREWLSRSGYRSGAQPIGQLVQSAEQGRNQQ